MAAAPESKKDGPFYFSRGEETMQEHNERMRWFRLAHPWVVTKAPPDVRLRAWLALPPVSPVELSHNSRN